MGHRGCRLGLTFPATYEVQVRAMVEAALDCGTRPQLKVVVPLVTAIEELRRLRRRIVQMAQRVYEERNAQPLDLQVGAMVESPRACLIAGQLADVADFLLFGSNDLTMATFCIDRDDAARYLPFYLENEVLPADPFVKLDREGVGELLRLGLERARARRPDIVCGLSGSQTADPGTVAFCHELGFDYVSCPAHRVPIARLAAARAAVSEGS